METILSMMISSFSELSLFLQVLLIWLVAINVIAFFYFMIDKYKASFGHRRIKEKTLWVLSLLGGTPGALASMYTFRHKTKKTSFQAVMLLIMLTQIGIIVILFGE